MSNPFKPDRPAGAYDDFYPEAAAISAVQPRWTEADGALPALYLSHGAPPLLDDAQWLRELFTWAQTIPKPTSILIVSAHWEQAPMMISGSAAHTDLVYDFGGFHPRYYQLRYRTPDASDLAASVASLMPDTEPLHQAPHRGLDHGAWVPLMAMYPLADVPVLQLSMPSHDPELLVRIGERLRVLRDQGILIVGSGFMTHGLPFMTARMVEGLDVPAWSQDFDAWASDALSSGRLDTLMSFRSEAPGMPYAHPTVEHFTPLFVTMGAASNSRAPVQTAIEGYFVGFSKRSFQVA